MKTLLVIGILVVGLSGQALSMGHPHNVFAARKQMRAKTAALVVKSKPSVCSTWQPVVQIDRNTLSKRLLAALSQIRPSKAY
jgi:hypothetical protein